jgi:hypothetical protein
MQSTLMAETGAGKKRTISEIRHSKKTGEKMDDEHGYSVDDEEYDKFLSLVESRRQM